MMMTKNDNDGDDDDDYDNDDKEFDLITILFPFQPKSSSVSSKLSFYYSVTTSALFETYHCLTFCGNECTYLH
jgi:hypothetical protein